jgi:hypothetical protein
MGAGHFGFEGTTCRPPGFLLSRQLASDLGTLETHMSNVRICGGVRSTAVLVLGGSGRTGTMMHFL